MHRAVGPAYNPGRLILPGFEDCGGVAIDPKLEQTIAWGLATFPEDRIGTATEFRRGLEAVLGYSPVARLTGGGP